MGIDVKVESPYGADGEVLGDAGALVSLFLGVTDLDGTKCLQFIDPYGDTLFNQIQIPVLIEELRTHLAQISANHLKSYKQTALRQARDANWQDSVVKQYQKEANASEFEVRSELSRLRQQIEGVIAVLNQAMNAGPHHYVRFMGD